MEALHSHRVKLPLPPLARTLLFFLPHPLPQLLADVSQRVHFGREGLHRVAEAARLRFPAAKKQNKKKNKLFKKERVFTSERAGEEGKRRAAYRSLRFCDCFIWLKSVGSGLFTGLQGRHTDGHTYNMMTSQLNLQVQNTWCHLICLMISMK